MRTRCRLARLVLVMFVLLAAGCLTPGGPRIASWYGSIAGFGGSRTYPHSGIDLLPGEDDAILAAADGVVQSLRGGTCGKGMLLHHRVGATDYYTVYCHMSAVAVAVGQTVRQGEAIGTIGATGWAAGETHLHFMVSTHVCDSQHVCLWNDGTLDPLDFIVGCFDPAAAVAPALTPAGAPRLTLTYPVRCRNPKRAS